MTKSNGAPLKIGLVSLGCPKNLVDSEEMLGSLVDAGYEIVSEPNTADVIVVNTCGFIEDAKEESIDTILEMTRMKTQGKCRSIVVTGCMAQRYAHELGQELPEVDAIVGVGQISALPDIVKRTLSGDRIVDQTGPATQWTEHKERVRATPSWTAYLKISDGCDNRCSYCAIPDIRGVFRSRPIELVLAEARKLSAEGVLEVNLVGQDITRYGEDTGDTSLVELLRGLAHVEGLRWIRLLYCYPTRISNELIELMASEPRVAKYMDIPMQHGDDRTLRRMNRSGSSKAYLDLISRIRAICPEVTLRTSFIVGFPGETDEEFANLHQFVKEIEFDRVGVFQYSQEDGTPAARLSGQVSGAVKGRRYKTLMESQQRISLERNESFIGSTIDVLIEEEGSADGSPATGRSYRDAPEIDGSVIVKGYTGQAGRFVRTLVKSASEYDMIADVV